MATWVAVGFATGCGAAMHTPDGAVDAGDVTFTTPDADAAVGAVYRTCPPAATGCALPTGNYVPSVDGEFQLVWVPANDRYVNEPTLIQDDAGMWHVFSNGATGEGGPWVEKQLLHATAPSLLGPWTEQPDILTTSDPGATESVLWAPFVLRDGSTYRVLYYDGAQPVGSGLHVAHADDLFHWTRDTTILPGGRDPFVMTVDAAPALYTTDTTMESDGIHDVVDHFAGTDATHYGAESFALRNPVVCSMPGACWGWYESPYVVFVGGSYYLFTTFTSSSQSDYSHTLVFRSSDPTHFDPTPIATLDAHGGELHLENGQMYLTRGGWPSRIGDAWRGLSVGAIVWTRVP